MIYMYFFVGFDKMLIISVYEFICSVGVLLFSPKNTSFSTIEEVGVYRHSRMLSLLGKDVRIL